jgi:hypothetical protein
MCSLKGKLSSCGVESGAHVFMRQGFHLHLGAILLRLVNLRDWLLNIGRVYMRTFATTRLPSEPRDMHLDIA